MKGSACLKIFQARGGTSPLTIYSTAWMARLDAINFQESAAKNENGESQKFLNQKVRLVRGGENIVRKEKRWMRMSKGRKGNESEGDGDTWIQLPWIMHESFDSRIKRELSSPFLSILRREWSQPGVVTVANREELIHRVQGIYTSQ